MAESSAGERDVWDVWAQERHRAEMAAKLLTCCLGIKARPEFDLAVDMGKDGVSPRLWGIGICLYKDAWYVGPADEGAVLEIVVVDEKGNALAGSKEGYHLERGLELMGRLPLLLSPQAEGWLKDALGESRPGAGQHPLEAAGMGWLGPASGRARA